MYLRNTLALATALAITLGVSERPAGQVAVYHVDVKNPNCSDAARSGSEDKPYCTVKYVSTIAKPGDTFLIHSGLYGPGPINFTRSGTATAPITYRAVGYVTFATEFADEELKPTEVPNVYSMPWTLPGGFAQTKFPPILVDDPNQSKFTIVQEDGPMRLSPAPDDAILAKIDGTYRVSDGVLRVHPFGNVVPSTDATDIKASTGTAAFNVSTSAKYNIFDGFTFLFSTSFAGSNNQYLNLTFRTQTFVLGGHNNHVENLTVSHVIQRAAPTWSWDNDPVGRGGGMAKRSSGNKLKNIHIFHNWNSSFSSEDSFGTVVDGARLHGAPNHCTVLANGNTTIRNAVLYNCQDYQWLADPNGLTMEHVVVPGGGIAISAVARTNGPITIRNSIFKGTVHFVRGTGAAASLPLQGCSWEKGSLMENNVIASDAKIERCANQTMYPILEYVAKCESGEFTDCMTIRNNRMIDPKAWKTVVKDGLWNAALEDKWDFSLVPNSPAIDAGTVSGTTTDIAGGTRPQGAAPDAGAYEAVSAPAPVDCVVSAWTTWNPTANWSSCDSKTGTQTRPEKRTRTIVTPPSGGGAACPAVVETRTASQSCPVDCQQSAWSGWTPTGEWSVCSYESATQTRTEERSRTVTVPPLNGGAACGPATETAGRAELLNSEDLVPGEPFRVTASHTITWMEWDTTPSRIRPCRAR